MDTKYTISMCRPYLFLRETGSYQILPATATPGMLLGKISWPPTKAALVSHRFHDLVTTPHAWRDAFSRYFPGPDVLSPTTDITACTSSDSIASRALGSPRAEKRLFARLTELASWRSEYILRTRLLRSLGRGKPAPLLRSSTHFASQRGGSGHNTSATVTYSSQLFTTVDQINANFAIGPNRKPPRFIHGASDGGIACNSDPSTGKVDNWGLSDPQTFIQFDERFPGDAPWGLGAGEVIGCPNVMDVSPLFGVVYGEGSPGGLVYFRSLHEMRGRFLASSARTSAPELGIPRIPNTTESMCSVWIAKSDSLPTASGGLLGILSGSSCGVLTSYSLGSDGLRDQRIDSGMITARWVLSPGVPIIAIAADDSFSDLRRAKRRIIAVALNALGEVFYLCDVPKRPQTHRGSSLDEDSLERLPWATGRTVHWKLVEPTRRVARADPYNEWNVGGSHSPRSSWDGIGLTKDQITVETQEIEHLLGHKPNHFRMVCAGWDMRRKLEVDFAGDDGSGTGESVVVIKCGFGTEEIPLITRFTRCKMEDTATQRKEEFSELGQEHESTGHPSIFGGLDGASVTDNSPNLTKTSLSNPASVGEISKSNHEEWRATNLSLGPLKSAHITASAIDKSTFSLLSTLEDPLLGCSSNPAASSPLETPPQQLLRTLNLSEIPGQRARYVAIGTEDGKIALWDIRGPTSANSELMNELSTLRVIHTDSPQISCLAISALCLVHGGNDGLVQAWDPLASNLQPIRTLNSRFSSQARRRLVQAEASTQGVGINLFAAGAICLDPDPTVLRGMVSLGTHLRYWSYSSSAADHYTSRKRRLRRRSERGSANGGGQGHFSGTGRSALKDYIVNEKLELEHEKEQRRKEADRLAGRFGVGLLGQGESEAEVLAYARMLSEETFAKDEEKRRSESESTDSAMGGDSSSSWSSETVTPEGSAVGRSSPPPALTKHDDEIDADLAEAIRLSLGGGEHEAPSSVDTSSSLSAHAIASSSSGPALRSSADLPIRYVKSRRSSPSTSPPARRGDDRKSSTATSTFSATKENSPPPLESDLDFALQLSLAEERSRREVEEEGSSVVGRQGGGVGKGKGKEKEKEKKRAS
ncbi:MAG: hypothetical protein M1837_003181 [Sclerophora amabilis]|nr:MAG: hypothetical protein M1837_003181 [Sclerophora amabilis]